MKDYEVSITTKVTLIRTIPAESAEEARKIAYDTTWYGRCTVMMDIANGTYNGVLREIRDKDSDIVVENPDEEE